MTSTSRFTRNFFIGALVLAQAQGGFAQTAAEIVKSIQLPAIPAKVLNLAKVGGRADGTTLNTTLIAKTIDELSKAGGGELLIPPGLWLTGPVQLKNNIRLNLEEGALLKFVSDVRQFPVRVLDVKGEKEIVVTSPLWAEGAHDIAIVGRGIIDGSGDKWRPLKKDKVSDRDWKELIKSGGILNEKKDTWWPDSSSLAFMPVLEQLKKSGSLNPADYDSVRVLLRPKLLQFVNCSKVLLEGVTFQNPPNWTVAPLLCHDVTIREIRVHNEERAQNSDALDLESCRNVLVTGSTFDAGDDGLCIKSGKDSVGRRIGEPSANIVIEGCTVYHAHGGFVIGSEMSGGVSNLWVNNCTFIGSDIGLRFKSTRGRGGVVEQIHISHIRMFDIPGDAINFNMYYGGKSPLDEVLSEAQSASVKVDEGTPQFRDIDITDLVCYSAKGGVLLQGLPEMPIKNIRLKDVTIHSGKGISLIHAEKVSLENCGIENGSGAAVDFMASKDCVFDAFRFPSSTKPVVNVRGAANQGNIFKHTSFDQPKVEINSDAGASKEALMIQ